MSPMNDMFSDLIYACFHIGSSDVEKEKEAVESKEDKPVKETEVKAEVKLKLSSPWAKYVAALKAMFGEDPDITIEVDEDNFTVKLFVDDAEKADAIARLLPESKQFGCVTLKITVVPPNLEEESKADLFAKAFEGNPAFERVRTVTGVMSNPMTFVVFAKEVVQYYIDNLGDLYGNRSTLYQELAKELFGAIDGVFYCTEVKDPE